MNEMGHAGVPFTIVRVHAQGGLGVVNLARDEHVGREVALKQILPEHAQNETLQKRFLYEARVTGQLEHPSIVPVYWLGEDAGANPYYVMRFVRGRTLDDIVGEHHVSPNPIVFRELLRRFIAVCQAVAYAHSRGVIHRDLKPSNIMLGDYGETLVLDWGLAKDVKQKVDPAMFREPVAKGATRAEGKGNQELTVHGQVVGTPTYMAPEQAEGRTDLHGPVTDIYALGGILYKILTGKSPVGPSGSVAGEGGARVLKFVASPRASAVNAGVDGKLDEMCARAMAVEAGARYPRALELAQDIQRWLDEHPLALRAPSAGARVVGKLRENVLVVVGVLMALIAGLGVLLVMHWKR